MTLPRFETLCRYWKLNPPTHVAAAAYLGIGIHAGRSSSGGRDLGELLALFGGQNGAIR
jgi:hypothetical protein